ncbi:hypothetical protein B0H14DRAFT_2608203 [Mycena olivaceomarginata]|nr:hypothetical protein B0H14DRAFT_2608203 [Mycena olivaceomarginata]
MHLPPPLEPHQKLPGSPPPFLPLYEKVFSNSGRVFKVLILAFTIYETNFHWFNLVSHCRELNTNDAPHFTGTALATHRAIHKLSIQFHGFLTSHIATLQIHISHSRGAADSQQTEQGRIFDLVMHASPPTLAIFEVPEDRRHLN